MSEPKLTDIEIVGQGLQRPEGLAIGKDGRVYAADMSATVTEVLPNGDLRPIGPPAVMPNGINLTVDGSAMIIAEFGSEQLQRLDLATGELTVICDEVEGRKVTRPNYPIVMPDGTIYCTSSTASDVIDCIVYGIDDGFIFRVQPDGSADIVADRMLLPNGLMVDVAGEHLYVVRTTACDVVRFPILSDGRLGEQEPYGPALAERTEWGEDGARFAWGDNPVRDYTTLSPELQPRWKLPDGGAFDVEGNLWVTLCGGDAIVAISPEGKVYDIAEATSVFRPSNIAFGGPDMCDVFIGSAEAPYLVRGRSSIPGVRFTGQ